MTLQEINAAVRNLIRDGSSLCPVIMAVNKH